MANDESFERVEFTLTPNQIAALFPLFQKVGSGMVMCEVSDDGDAVAFLMDQPEAEPLSLEPLGEWWSTGGGNA